MDRPNILAVIQSDLQLIRSLRAELESKGVTTLNVARNSEEAILYLRGVGIYGDRIRFPLPNALVLDCDNSDHSDLDVLSWAREQKEFRKLPIFLLCPEHHPAPMHCVLDHSCYVVDRNKLPELSDALMTSESVSLFSMAMFRY